MIKFGYNVCCHRSKKRALSEYWKHKAELKLSRHRRTKLRSKHAKRRNLRYHNVSRDANTSLLRLVFLSTLRSRSSRFGNNVQKFIKIVKTNMKAPEIIDYTCTVASISSISRFACANVWSVRVVTKSIYVTFVGICFAFVNICQKKQNKEKRMKNGICVLFKSHTCTCIWKQVEYSFAIFLFHAILGLDLQFKPLFFNFFLWYGKDYLKHTL